MEEPKPLDSLFKEKIFRIPDYQRGYAPCGDPHVPIQPYEEAADASWSGLRNGHNPFRVLAQEGRENPEMPG
jgi:hypothetical protein